MVDRGFADAGELHESTSLMLREAIFERASREERKLLLEGTRAEPAPTLEQAVAETFPDL